MIMTRLISLFLISGLAKELAVTNVTVLFSPADPLRFTLRLNQEHIVATYPNHESTISLTVRNKDRSQRYTESYCYSQPKRIQFAEFQSRAQQVLEHSIPPPNKQRPPDKYLPIDPLNSASTPGLANMVQTTDGFAAVTNDHRLLVFSVNETSQQVITREEKRIQFNSNSKDTPQMVYDPKTFNLYIIYSSEIFQANLKDLNALAVSRVQLSNMGSSPKLGTVRIMHSHLFVPLGVSGIQFYKIETNGLLTFSGQLDSELIYGQRRFIMIVDVAFGGDQGQHMYVLDSFSGVTVFRLDFIGADSISLNLDKEFGQITIFGGNIIKEFNNSLIMVLCQYVSQTYLMEVAVNMVTKEWFEVQTHFVFGHYSDVEIGESFAILRGVDSHLLVYHSIYKRFLPEASFLFSDDWRKEERVKDKKQYLILPALKQLRLYSSNLLLGTFNQTHPFLLAITSHAVVTLPWIQVDPYVVCNADKALAGAKDKFIVELNSTQCPEKSQLLASNPELNKQLILCSQQQLIEIEVEPSTGMLKWEWTHLGLAILALTFLVVIAIVQFRRRMRLRKERIEKDIRKLQDRGFETSDNP